jgi:hypothetical protein
MRRGVLLIMLGATLVSAELGGGATTATATRIVDRTLLCRVSGIGYPDSVRYLTARASPYDAGFDVAPQMSVGQGSVGVPGWGAYARTGPAGRNNESPTGQVTLPRTEAGRCSNTRLRVPLSSRDLRAGSPGEQYRCDAPAKVLVRLRAVFKRPTFFRRDARFPDQMDAPGNITNAFVAVTTLRDRKPLAFLSVHEKGGAARVFVARSCAQTP